MVNKEPEIIIRVPLHIAALLDGMAFRRHYHGRRPLITWDEWKNIQRQIQEQVAGYETNLYVP